MTSLLILKSILLASYMNRSRKKKTVKKKKIVKSESKFKRCRICNQQKGHIPLFNNEAHPHIAEEIKHFSGVTINRNDNLPKYMCQGCMDLLNGCIKFRDMCQNSNKLQLEHSIKEECPCYKIETNNLLDCENSYDMPSPPMYIDNSDIWDCSTCSKKFHDMTSYNNHLNKCTSQVTDDPRENGIIKKKSFLCDICGKTAKSKGSLNVHRVIHEDVFPYKCDTCSYRGRTLDLLKVHKRSHLADKPFKCTLCPKTATTTSNLAKHMRHVHSTCRPYKKNFARTQMENT
ncbi:PREDICTED: zinc finger protein 85-like isoform X2 [Papilio polytes]|uniref:zinc finger protein 85-like isoform X2 n=1 Tax=Papilio polytes TaxID=76194 RepID=UPI0006769126|nr:PREDICTED: zinc finger protein 85-like isoform X2 [Papilio polytes]